MNVTNSKIFAIQGSSINWAWSLRDLMQDKLSPSAKDGSSSPKEVERKKKKYTILWAFNRKALLDSLKKALDTGFVRVLLVFSRSGISGQSRGILATGRVSSDDIFDREIPWDYWPEGEGWNYKFFIKVDKIAPSVLKTIPILEKLKPEDFKNRRKIQSEVFSKWITDVIALVPSSVMQGSLFPVPEIAYRQANLLVRNIFTTVTTVPIAPTWDHSKVLEVLKSWEVFIPEDIVEASVRALESGKHLLLWGIPGTGKTTLARAIAEAHNLDLVVRTATAEWSRTDLIGGPIFVGGKVMWRCGALLEAIARHYEGVEKGSYSGALLLIDEINRANLDRTFGEFFTIFSSSDPKDWYIPESIIYEMKEYRENIDRWGKYLLKLWESQGKGPLKVPENFRVIGTMNTYDRRYLFTLGYALLRRFAVVELRNPEHDTLRSILRQYCKRDDIIEEVMNFYKILRDGTGIEFGVALLIDVAKLAHALAGKEDPKRAVDKALETTIIVHFEGFELNSLKKVVKILEDRGYELSSKAFRRLYPEILEQ